MTRRSPRVRMAAVLAAAVSVLVACGGGDEGGVATTVDVDDPTAEAPAAGADGPNATVSPDLPENIRSEFGPVEVVGDALPQLAGAAVADDEALGLTAPVLIGQDYARNPVRVDAATDGPTMVVFLAHWCPHCNSEVPRLNGLRDAGAFPDGLNVVAVSTAVNPSQPNFPPSEWITSVDWTYPVIADGVDMDDGSYIAADAYGVDGFPFTVLVDGDGAVVARWSGEREPDDVLADIGTYLGLS